MTDALLPHRKPAMSGDGMVASSHLSISLAGARVLRDGGNAVDAALAMAAMCWVALPGQCGIGGDAFAMVREPHGSVWTVCGSGYGPDGGDPDFYRAKELTAIPLEGPLAVAVPGAIAALNALHQEGASTPLSELWGPAAETADRGIPCSAKTREDLAEHFDALQRDPGARAAFLPDGGLPAVGTTLPQPELAETVRKLAADPCRLYSGDLAERAVETLAAGGAPFSGDEWAEMMAVTPGPALGAEYNGLTVHQTPLPTPGWMHLQQAAICEAALPRLPWLSGDALGWLAGAACIAFRDRRRWCGADSESWRALLTQEALAAARMEIEQGAVVPASGAHSGGDTTSLVAVDGEGRAVSLIHSLAFTFGARMSVPGTGIMLNNRLGRGAYLIDGHPNAVRPRRKPLHTLNAWMATDSTGRLVHVGNTPGGDGQVQWNMQILSHLVDHGLDPQQAVTAPRFTQFPGSDADVVGMQDELRCESRIPEPTRGRLEQLGHRVTTIGPWAAGGSAMVVSVDSGAGTLRGGADPRQDGVVLGV